MQYTSTIVSLLGQLLPDAARPSRLVRVLLTSAVMVPLATASELSALNFSTILGLIGGVPRPADLLVGTPGLFDVVVGLVVGPATLALPT